MPQLRRLPRDPRTVARDIPGILDALFPQLAPGVVLHLNNTSYSVDACESIDERLVAESRLQNAMLFEIAYAVTEQRVPDQSAVIDWAAALAVAVRRQRSHFDAKLPEGLDISDQQIAIGVARNAVQMLSTFAPLEQIVKSPFVPGLQWIASGVGDFGFDRTLVEMKCTARRFGASDYRQILMYWLLSYAASIEGRGTEWEKGVLMNPRLNLVVVVDFDDLLRTVGAGRTKVEVLELFRWLIGDHSSRLIEQV